MFGPIRRLFGGGESPEQFEARFARAKEDALRAILGQAHTTVLHSLIPYFAGGGLDLYPFKFPRGGTLYVTMEVIEAGNRNAPLRSRLGRYELVGCTRKEYRDADTPALRPPVKPAGADQPDADDPDGSGMVSSMLNPIARYSSMAVLSPGETMEIPGDEADGSDSQFLLFDEFDTGGREFRILQERCWLLLCMRIHRSECDFARSRGVDSLIDRLKQFDFYPYSDLERSPVA